MFGLQAFPGYVAASPKEAGVPCHEIGRRRVSCSPKVDLECPIVASSGYDDVTDAVIISIN